MRDKSSDDQDRASVLFGIIILFASVLSNSHAGEKQPVMGAGPSTVVAHSFFRHFSLLPAAQDYEFTVESRSIKHAGGIRASGQYLFGRTGRPLNKKEKQQNKHDLFIARIPLTFVAGKKTGVKHITLKQLEDIFSRKITNWKTVGGADAGIILAGRESTEAALSLIQRDYPYFHDVEFDKVLTRDHQLVNFIQSPQGDYAIGFGARPNFDDAYMMHVDGFKTGVSLGLVYDTKNSVKPVVKSAIKFARSEDWRNLVLESGLLAPE